ncbi:MAG TPA: serine hydrolase [Candidatus Acidoferrales bacterium]|nr:serine hydrolase [Candidatus Acidoferrales bacterium]
MAVEMRSLRLVLAIASAAGLMAIVGAAATPLETGGRALDVQGRPVAGLRAELVSGTGVVSRAWTDTRGRFGLSGLHLMGTYQVRIQGTGFLTAMVPAGTAQTVVVHRLPSLVGRVLDDTGAGVAGAGLELSQAGRPGIISLESDEDGFFWLLGRADPGNYRLTVSARAHDPFRANLALASDHTLQVTPVLPRELGTLTLSSDPSGVAPVLDGQALPGCAATPCTVPLAVGSHTISLETDLYVPWSHEFNLRRHDSISLSAVLERKTGLLELSGPAAPDAELDIDGSAVYASTWSGRLPTGTHRVAYRAGAYWPALASVGIDWNQTATLGLRPSVVATDASGFIGGLDAYLSSLGGQYGVYLQDLGSGRELGSRDQNTLMEAASVIKLPVALFTYHQAEARKIKLDDLVTLQDSDFMGGTGVLNGTAKSGDRYSYRDLLAYLIQQSDNTAWMALRRVLEDGKIDAFSASVGAPDCLQDVDGCTAREAGLMLAGLYRGRILNRANSDALLGLLETTVFNDRINWYLSGYTIAHKVGMDGGVINDSGIVFLGGRPFVISMFTYTDDPAKGTQAIRDVARAAAYYFGAR